MWMTGVEHDEYVRQNDAWVHQSMKLDVVFMAPYDRGWSSAPRNEGASIALGLFLFGVGGARYQRGAGDQRARRTLPLPPQ